MEEAEASTGAESSLASRAMHVCIVFRVAGVQQNSCCVLHVWEPCPCRAGIRCLPNETCEQPTRPSQSYTRTHTTAAPRERCRNRSPKQPQKQAPKAHQIIEPKIEIQDLGGVGGQAP